MSITLLYPLTTLHLHILDYFTTFSSQNYVVGNYIAFNNDATHFVGSQSNVFHHNNFVDNSRDISKDSSYYDIRIVKSINFWDDGKEGNYWSKYFDYWSKNGIGNNGIGTLPYELNEFNKDNYPLLELVKIESYTSYSSTNLPYPTPTLSPLSSNNPTSINPTSPPTGTQSTTPTIEDTNSESTTVPLSAFITVIAVLALTAVALTVLLYRRHRKNLSQNKPNV